MRANLVYPCAAGVQAIIVREIESPLVTLPFRYRSFGSQINIACPVYPCCGFLDRLLW